MFEAYFVHPVAAFVARERFADFSNADTSLRLVFAASTVVQ